MPTQTRERRRPTFRRFLLFLLLALCALPARAQAQEATSTAAAARTRYLSERGLIPESRTVAVEEFVNYHRHQIGRPKAGEAVLLDVRWGNDRVSAAAPEAVALCWGVEHRATARAVDEFIERYLDSFCDAAVRELAE